MSWKNSTHMMLGLGLATVASLTTGDAQAIFKERTLTGNATNFCQSSMPVFDVQIRKRPLSVQNEGTASAFVTCAFSSQEEIKLAVTYFHSTAGTPQMLTCTGVAGANKADPEQPDPVYVVKSVLLDGAGTSTQIVWSPADFGAVDALPGGALFGLNCNLAPGMGVDATSIVFREDVG